MYWERTNRFELVFKTLKNRSEEIIVYRRQYFCDKILNLITVNIRPVYDSLDLTNLIILVEYVERILV